MPSFSAPTTMDDKEKGTLPAPLPPPRPRKFPLLRLLVAFGLALLVHHSASSWHARPRRPHRRPHRLFGKLAESAFLTVPDEKSALHASRQFATKPHVAGSTGDLATAMDFLTLLQTELGITPPDDDPVFPAGSAESQRATRGIPRLRSPQAWIDTYYPVMNMPLERSVQVVDDDGTVLWDADLKEYAPDADPEAAKYADAVPTFHGLSKAGDVTGHVVDGNYCTKEDYDKLVEQDTPLNGSIILCRYGGVFRGLKVKGGQEVNASGVLIYSDPRDDGTVTIENGYQPYPFGPARNPTSVQRGSVQFLSVYPGDPTTPGYPAYENSTRTEGVNIPSIPSLPISWGNAEKLLKVLDKGGPWEGKRVRLANNVDTKVIPIWNTMGVIPGHIRNEVVVVGNHRDAWVMGAADPSSGTASIHEVVRAFGHLTKRGWKPLRTIVIASWDAEEYGLIGSTEWGEDFVDWIDTHVIAYVNLDGSASGSRFSASGSPLLAHFIRQAALDLPHPTNASRTLWDARDDSGSFFGAKAEVSPEVQAMHDMQMSAADALGVGVLGSGSDYTVFLQRNGIPSTNGGGFGSTLHDPVYHYHSVFDSERWMEVYADPGFFRHVAAAKHVGLQTLRLSASIVLPFNTTHYAYELESYLDKVESIASSQSIDVHFNPLRRSIHTLQEASASLDSEKADAAEELHKIIEKWRKKRSHIKWKLRKIYCRIRRALGHKCRRRKKKEFICGLPATTPDLRIPADMPAWLKAQHEQLDQLEELENDIAYGVAVHSGIPIPRRAFVRGYDEDDRPRFPIEELKRAVRRIMAVNRKLSAFERGLISEDGIKDREWFKHLGVAPGKWLGYGATTLPGLTESLTFEKNATLADYEAGRLKELIDSIAGKIRVD